jgi:hypothetical protein
MHRREIDATEYELLYDELVDVQHLPGMIDIVTGRHEELGLTVLLQQADLHVALVEDASFIDQVEASGDASPTSRAIGRAMRVGR